MVLINGLFIFRRDFRLHDNTTLHKALHDCDTVTCIFIFSKTQTSNNKHFNSNSFQFMINALQYLNTLCNGKLSLWYTDNEPHLLTQLINVNKINTVYFNSDITDHAVSRDAKIIKLCSDLHIDCVTLQDYTLWNIGTIQNGKDEAYKVFTPFYNKCKNRRVTQLLTHKLTHKLIHSNKSYTKGYTTLQRMAKMFNCSTPNINSFTSQLQTLISSITDNTFNDYSKMRDYLHYNTTGLAVYLKFGLLSCRHAYQLVHKDIKRQLIWREFYYHLFGSGYTNHVYTIADNYKWKIPLNNASSNPLIKDWKNGNTGDLLVDTLMKELKNYGTMHNRGRMIVASYLIFTLHADWRIGELHFAGCLLDYDPLVNRGNWYWVNSHPLRKLNSITQAKKYGKQYLQLQ